ncbi:MAG: hypothetical protein JW982_00650 [Spirochaetes bacterium]|nr:hypothetical protein [Spirochaetota bacterium]
MNKKLNLLFLIIIACTLGFGFLPKRECNRKYIIKFSKKYAVDETNNVFSDVGGLFITTEANINETAFELLYIIQVLNINFVKVKYHIPSQGDYLRLFLLCTNNHIYLINKKVIYSDYIDSPPDEELKKVKENLAPIVDDEINKVPPGYDVQK